MPQEKPFLMGSETEYSVAVTQPGVRPPMRPEQLAYMLVRGVNQISACLPDGTQGGGMFLQNGGRLYIDINGHPEYCTPECMTPEQVATYDRAGELILLALSQSVRVQGTETITVIKNNLTSVRPDTATFGNHESYTSWVDLPRAAEALMGHLVSRVAYAGAGCLSPYAGGTGFELSQRARHLVREIGSETTHSRAIFCTRIRKRSDVSQAGWTRAHLISKDSQRAPLGNYLTFGTTGLLFWILNHGGSVGTRLRPSRPVQALRTISHDPLFEQRVPLADRRKLTALEIQQEYLAECQAFAAKHELPAWGHAVLRCWEGVLTSLARDPIQLATRLDTYAKLLMLDHEVRRAGLMWPQVRDALALVDQLRKAAPRDIVFRALLAEEPNGLAEEDQTIYKELVSQVHAAGREALDRVRFVLRLQVLDQKYHELGGVYDRLVQQGHMEGTLSDPSDAERAVCDAPQGGRAAARAALVKQHHGQAGWLATWDSVIQGDTGEGYDLSDPFMSEPKPLALDEAPNEMSPTRRSLLRRLMSL
jgi:hypothetical protein